MGKIKLIEQDQYEFRHEIKIQVSDISYSGAVGCSELSSILHDSRINIFKDIYNFEKDLIDNRTRLIIDDIIINFHKDIHLGETIIIFSHLDDISENGFRIFQKVSRKGKTIAISETGLSVMDTEKKEKTFLSEKLISTLKLLQI